MKKLIIIFLICFTSTAFAQIDGDYNFSFGIKALNFSQMPKILQQTYPDDYYSSGITGAMLKFNDNQIAFRLSGNYNYTRNKKFSNICDNCEEAKGSLTDYSVKIGFEKNFNYSVIQPYFAFDIGYRTNTFKGDVRPTSSSSLTQPYMAIATKNSAVLSPIIGVKINISPQFSLYTESSLDLLYSYERQEKIQYDVLNTRTMARYNKNEFLINAITFGLQFHFVGNN